MKVPKLNLNKLKGVNEVTVKAPALKRQEETLPTSLPTLKNLTRNLNEQTNQVNKIINIIKTRRPQFKIIYKLYYSFHDLSSKLLEESEDLVRRAKIINYNIRPTGWEAIPHHLMVNGRSNFEKTSNTYNSRLRNILTPPKPYLFDLKLELVSNLNSNTTRTGSKIRQDLTLELMELIGKMKRMSIFGMNVNKINKIMNERREISIEILEQYLASIKDFLQFFGEFLDTMHNYTKFYMNESTKPTYRGPRQGENNKAKFRIFGFGVVPEFKEKLRQIRTSFAKQMKNVYNLPTNAGAGSSRNAGEGSSRRNAGAGGVGESSRAHANLSALKNELGKMEPLKEQAWNSLVQHVSTVKQNNAFIQAVRDIFKATTAKAREKAYRRHILKLHPNRTNEATARNVAAFVSAYQFLQKVPNSNLTA
jgi:hypothetical protein